MHGISSASLQPNKMSFALSSGGGLTYKVMFLLASFQQKSGRRSDESRR